VVGQEHVEDPWKDLAPVRTAFASAAHNDGFYTVHDVEPAFLAEEVDDAAPGMEALGGTVQLLSDCLIRKVANLSVDGWMDGVQQVMD
jgi:hypothetical protein